MIDSPSPSFADSRFEMSELTSNRCGAEDLYVNCVCVEATFGVGELCAVGDGGWIGHSGR